MAQRRGQIQSCEQQIAWRIKKSQSERGTAAALFTLQSRCAGIDQFQGDL